MKIHYHANNRKGKILNAIINTGAIKPGMFARQRIVRRHAEKRGFLPEHVTIQAVLH